MRYLFLFFIIFLVGCIFKDFESNMLISPTGNHYIIATVNRTKSKREDYATVIIHLFNKRQEKIIDLNSKVGDAQKLAIGWTESGDTVVLQSSDIGNQAWKIENNGLVKIEMNDKLNKRAAILYSDKYE